MCARMCMASLRMCWLSRSAGEWLTRSRLLKSLHRSGACVKQWCWMGQSYCLKSTKPFLHLILPSPAPLSQRHYACCGFDSAYNGPSWDRCHCLTWHEMWNYLWRRVNVRQEVQLTLAQFMTETKVNEVRDDLPPVTRPLEGRYSGQRSELCSCRKELVKSWAANDEQFPVMEHTGR